MVKRALAVVAGASLLMAGCVSQSVRQRAERDRALEATLANVTLENATADEAVQVVCDEWRKALGGHAPPFIIRVDYSHPPSQDQREPRPTVTCSVRDIPVREMLRVLQLLTPYRIFVEKSVVVFQEHHPGIIEPWETCAVHVSPAGQRFLRLKTGMTSAELKVMLSSYGLVFPEGSVAEWQGQAGVITMTNLPQEQGKLTELMFLVDQGYVVTPALQGAARGSGTVSTVPGQ